MPGAEVNVPSAFDDQRPRLPRHADSRPGPHPPGVKRGEPAATPPSPSSSFVPIRPALASGGRVLGVRSCLRCYRYHRCRPPKRRGSQASVDIPSLCYRDHQSRTKGRTKPRPRSARSPSVAVHSRRLRSYGRRPGLAAREYRTHVIMLYRGYLPTAGCGSARPAL
jgi:hypothetical protein